MNISRTKAPAMRLTATLLSFALIQVSFCPEAWAQVIRVNAVAAPVGGASAAAGPLNAGGSAAAAMPSAAFMSASPLAAAAFNSAAPSVAASPVSALAASSIGSPAEASHTPAPAEGDIAAATPSPAPAAETALVSGPRTAGVGARMASRIAELRKFFTGRRDAGPVGPASGSVAASGAAQGGELRSNGLAAAPSTANDKVAQGGGDNAPPAPASAPQDSKKSGMSKTGWFGLGAAGASIIAYALTMQVGLEAQGVAMPQLTQNAFGDFSLLPLVTIFASIGSMIGQPMSKFISERFGLAKTFYAAHALRAISLSAMVLLLGTGLMSIPLMMGFYLFNGIVTGVAATAEGTLRKLILADRGVSQESFRTWWQMLAESFAVPAPIFFGGLVHTLGMIGAPLVTALYPVTILLGLTIAYLLRVYPLKDVKKASDQAARTQGKETAAKTEAAPSPEKTGVWNAIKSAVATILKNMEEGKTFVLNHPYLKYSLIMAASFDMFNIIIYRLIAPGYGKMIGGAAGLSAFQGNMVGMFSLGGLLLSVFFIVKGMIAKKRAAKNASKDGASETEKAAASAAAERTSMLRWALAGIPALALLSVMAFHIVLPLAPLIFLGSNWLPSSMLAAVLIPFGFFQVAASIKLNSYFQEKLPQDAGKVQKALAFSGSVMTGLSIVAMLALRPLFSAVDVFNPFPWIALALIPIAVGLFFLRRKLAAATTPESVAAADAAQKEREAAPGAPQAPGGYVGMVLGIAVAAVVITALPMIPGVAGVLKGLGVLAKFGFNLGLTLLFPVSGYVIGRLKGRSKAAGNAPR